jgi:hypothetical protein
MPETREDLNLDAATGNTPEEAPADEFQALDNVDFLDDIDFSLEDVESRIAPLALAHL